MFQNVTSTDVVTQIIRGLPMVGPWMADRIVLRARRTNPNDAAVRHGVIAQPQPAVRETGRVSNAHIREREGAGEREPSAKKGRGQGSDRPEAASPQGTGATQPDGRVDVEANVPSGDMAVVVLGAEQMIERGINEQAADPRLEVERALNATEGQGAAVAEVAEEEAVPVEPIHMEADEQAAEVRSVTERATSDERSGSSASSHGASEAGSMRSPGRSGGATKPFMKFGVDKGKVGHKAAWDSANNMGCATQAGIKKDGGAGDDHEGSGGSGAAQGKGQGYQSFGYATGGASTSNAGYNGKSDGGKFRKQAAIEEVEVDSLAMQFTEAEVKNSTAMEIVEPHFESIISISGDNFIPSLAISI